MIRGSSFTPPTASRLCAWLTFVVLTLPAQVLACPVCSPGRDDATRQAFFDTTIFLSLLPLAMFGGIAYWFIRRARAIEAQHDIGPTAEE